jgi:biopolymer transport protein ExbD
MIDFKSMDSRSESANLPDLTPLIDVIFLLLVFFLLTSYISRPMLTVDLPEAENASAQRDGPFTVTVHPGGTLTVDGAPVTDGGLKSMLRLFASSEQGNPELTVQADGEVLFERVVEVMDWSRGAGIYRISFLVKRNE